MAFREKFAGRKGARRLDYSEPASFRLTKELAYQDDPEGNVYEILTNPESGERFFVFEMSAYRDSSFWDPEVAFAPVEFTL